jgi:hypothetical protein
VARATVQEPNGINVPAPPITTGCANVTCTGGKVCENGACEMPLQGYFDMHGEAIDAHADASVEPGAFQPVCDFQATLVLSESQASAGIAWYNQPASPTGPPPASDLHPIGPATLTLGQAITSADIRSNPAYTGGLIGFALMKQLGNPAGPTPVYYSEYKRNVLCSGCAIKDYWKMALAYQSKDANSYYLAFEDWEGADQSSWQGNDGDFNDKVFKFSGVTCMGGGQICDTQMKGVCAVGVTQCQVGGAAPSCASRVKPTAEVCDNLDNDCNGMVDDNATCPIAGWVCDHGTCVHPCDDTSEFKCVPGLQCDQGLCKDPKCIGVTCNDGQICRAGTCVGGCTGVTCPIGQTCQLGVCVDLCAGVTCTGGACENGVCVAPCSCRVCGAGKTCGDGVHCVDTGCASATATATMSCPAGQVCQAGGCKDPCTGAACPGGAACHDGQCDPPTTMTTSTGSGGSGGTSGAAGTTGLAGIGGGGTSAGGTTGASGTTGIGATGGVGAAGTTGGTGPQGHGGTIACNCSTAAGPELGVATLALLGLAVGCRRRGRRSDSSR